MAIYQTSLVSKRKLTASEFLRSAEKNPERTAGARFVPPKIGSKGFGHFEVKPRYEVMLDR